MHTTTVLTLVILAVLGLVPRRVQCAIDLKPAEPVDVVLKIEWTASTTATHLQRLVGALPQDVIELYRRRLVDELAVDIELAADDSEIHKGAHGRDFSERVHYATYEHPTRFRARRTAIVRGKLYDAFEQFKYAESSGGGERKLQESASGAPKKPVGNGVKKEKAILKRAQDIADRAADAIRDTLLQRQQQQQQQQDAPVVGTGRRLQRFRGIVDRKDPADDVGDGPAAVLQHASIVPTLRIVVLREARFVRFGSTSEWHLDRLNQHALPLDGDWTLPSDMPTPNISSLAWVYVVDSGILGNHVELSSRVTAIYDEYPSLPAACDVHGTHVAALIGGTTVGVNPYARIFDTRVLDCEGSGTLSGLLRGLSEINSHCSGQGGGLRRSVVINISLGAELSPYSPEGRAVAAELSAARENCDAVIVAAAGNNAGDACNFIPAALTGVADGGVIAVGATTKTDVLAYYSNFGPCVSIQAPGDSIRSALSTGPTNYGTLSGTSMASPIVAGVASLHTARRDVWLNTYPVNLYADVVYQLAIVDESAKDRITLSAAATNAGTTRNLIQRPLNIDYGGGDSDIIVVIPPPNVSDRVTPGDDPDDATALIPNLHLALCLVVASTVLLRMLA